MIRQGRSFALAAIVLCSLFASCNRGKESANSSGSPAIQTRKKPDLHPAPFVGHYQASLPAASSPGRKILLALKADSSAEMVTDYLNDKPPTMERGVWKPVTDSTVEVSLSSTNGAPANRNIITFGLSGTTLRALLNDTSLYGTEGLSLARRPLTLSKGTASSSGTLVGILWKWQELTTPVERIPVSNPDGYALQIEPEGLAKVRADCNRGSGKCDFDVSRITFGPIATTRAACPPGSLSEKYLKSLQTATVYSIDGKQLLIELKSGLMTFINGE